MTREEAIEEIKRWTPILLTSGQCTEKTSEAQDMAISALSEKDKKFYYDHGYAQAKRDLAENKGDLISRQAVLELLQMKYFGKDLYRAIYELPSVGNNGEWIAQDIHNCHTNFKCSKCGYIHSFMHLYGEPRADYSFCPDCGADMRKPKGEKGTE